MNKTGLVTGIALAALLSGCGGGGSTSSTAGPGVTEEPATENPQPGNEGNEDNGGEVLTTTTFSVTVDNGVLPQSELAQQIMPMTWTDRVVSLFVPMATAEEVPGLAPENFKVVILNPDGTSTELSADEFEVEDLGNGQYAVTVPGDPRFDCYIGTDLNGDGVIDLRAPTVSDQIVIDPVSEYVTTLLEDNVGNFANFTLAEVNAILTQVQQQVAENPELRAALNEAVASGEPGAVNTLLNEETTVVTQFELAALPAPENTANLAGDYHFLGQTIAIERTNFASTEGSDFPGGIVSTENFIFDAALLLDSDLVTLQFGSQETIAATELAYGTDGFVNQFEMEQLTETIDDASISGGLTSLGFNFSVGGEGPEVDGTETETQLKSTINFIDVTGSSEGFVSANRQRFEYSNEEEDGTFTSTMSEFPWFVLAKKHDNFSPADLEGDWGFVNHLTQLEDRGNVINEVEAISFSIDADGQFLLPADEVLFFGFETEVTNNFFIDQFGSLELGSDVAGTVLMTYQADGSFSLPAVGEASAMLSKGVVFAGNNMLVLMNSEQYVAVDEEDHDESESSVLFAVRQAEEPLEAIKGKSFLLNGRSYYNEASVIEANHFSPVTLSFNETGTQASIEGVASFFRVNTPADGGAERLSETFVEQAIPVTVASSGQLQITLADEFGTLALNGFIGVNGQNLILTLAVLDDDGGEKMGDTGLLVGRCSKNCQ